MTPDQLAAAKTAADFAAAQSDRWLFIALLIVSLIAIAALAKWGMRQLDLRDLAINDLRKELGDVRKENASVMVAQSERFATIIAQNTAAITANTELNRRIMERESRLEIIRPVPPLKDFTNEGTIPKNLNT